MPEDMAEAERHLEYSRIPQKRSWTLRREDPDGYARRPISHMLPLTYPKGQEGCHEIFSD
jgi:hypothetical protein